MPNPALANVLRQVEAEKSVEPWYAPYETPADKVAADTMRAGGPRWTPTGEILRGAYFPPAPAAAAPAAQAAPVPVDEAPAVAPDGPTTLGGVTATAPDQLSQHLAATEAARRKAEETARGRAGAMGAAVEAVGRPPVLPPPPKSPTMPPAPDVGLRAFMTPGEKASATEVLRNFVGLIGATMGAFGGASRHAAAGSLSALTGAMKGWMEGDRERVTRELERWRIDSERLLKQHELELSEYNSILKNAELSWDHKVQLLKFAGLQWDNQVFADSLAVEHQEKSLKELEDRWAKSEDLKLGHLNAERQLAVLQAQMEHARKMEELKAREIAVKEKAAETSPFTPADLDIMARMYITTGRQPAFGMGASVRGDRARFWGRVAALSADYGGPEGITARQASIGGLRQELAQVMRTRGLAEAFSGTAKRNLENALEISSKIDRPTGKPMIDRFFLAGRKEWSGDPGVAEFTAAVRTAINETARVLSTATAGGVVSDTARHEIEGMLNTAMNKAQFLAVVRRLQTEMENRRAAYDAEVVHIEKLLRETSRPEGKAAPSGPARKILIGPDGKRYDGSNVQSGQTLTPGWRLIEE